MNKYKIIFHTTDGIDYSYVKESVEPITDVLRNELNNIRHMDELDFVIIWNSKNIKVAIRKDQIISIGIEEEKK